MRTIRFGDKDDPHVLWIYDCVYCGRGKVIVEKKVKVNTGYGSHTDYIHVGFLAGGRKSKNMLCDSCGNFDKRIDDLKELELKIKRAERQIEDFGKLMDDFRSSTPKVKT